MRSSKNRSRSKSNRQRSLGNIVNRVFDSSGPEGKVRGTPQQIIDKYLALARDAQVSNDRVAEQNFLQHAEHYTRMLAEAQREMQREQESRQPNQTGGHEGGAPNGGNGQPNGYGQHGGGDDRGGERNADRGGERQQQNRRRYDDQRGERGNDDYRRAAVVDEARSDDEGPGLVETPESRLAAQPVASMMPDLSQAAAATPAGEAPASEPRKPAQRRPRKPRAKSEAEAASTPVTPDE